jgi:arsenite methyltransferase
MSDVVKEELALNVDTLRQAIQEEYAEVASHPEKGFHFHTGRHLAHKLEYLEEWLEGIPESSIESFAGTGNPFSLGELHPGEQVVDVGCGAGIDTLIAAKKVGSEGRVIGVDMTPSMLEKARRAAKETGLTNVAEFREGYAEALPVDDGWADVVISNGVVNLMPDKAAVLEEDTIDEDTGYGRLIACRSVAQKLALVGAVSRPASNHPVAFGYQILNRNPQIRQAGTVAAHKILKPLQATHLSSLSADGTVADEVGSEQLVD